MRKCAPRGRANQLRGDALSQWPAHFPPAERKRARIQSSSMASRAAACRRSWTPSESVCCDGVSDRRDESLRSLAERSLVAVNLDVKFTSAAHRAVIAPWSA